MAQTQHKHNDDDTYILDEVELDPGGESVARTTIQTIYLYCGGLVHRQRREIRAFQASASAKYAGAVDHARANGWRVSGREVLCPDCARQRREQGQQRKGER